MAQLKKQQKNKKQTDCSFIHKILTKTKSEQNKIITFVAIQTNQNNHLLGKLLNLRWNTFPNPPVPVNKANSLGTHSMW